MTSTPDREGSAPTAAPRAARFKLTNSSVRERCRPPEPGQTNGRGSAVLYRFYWDTELRGFALVVGHRTRTFIVQKDIAGRSVRVTIGRLGAWTVDLARKRARELIVEMDQGVDPNRRAMKRARGVTLAEAMAMHLSAMKARHAASRSTESLREEMERHLSDWLARPLSAIRRNDCAVRHERITEGSGPYAANRVLTSFRACYNTAARRIDDLPPNPTRGVTFNKVRRRREPMAWADLPGWKAKVDAIANPVRRDLQLFILFTGLRSTDARTVRWEHVNFEAGTVHRPKPKGGEDRAFTVPVSGFVLDLLRRRREENQTLYPDDGGWVFPSRDMQGRIACVSEAKEQRYSGRKKVGHLPSPRRLRDTFASAAHEAHLHPLDLKVLMNHTLPAADDVTEGYIRPSVEHLRGAVEAVAVFLLGRTGSPA